MTYETERRVAIETVLRACRLCQSVRATLVTADAMAKKDKSPVTVADFGAQAIVSHDLAAAFPGDPLVGEEHAGDLAGTAGAAIKAGVVRSVRAIAPELDEPRILTAISRGTHAGGARGRFWTLDPIDGTKGFLRGEQYAVALALIEGGVPVLGVLGCPNLPLDATRPDAAAGCLFVAVRGQGAFLRRVLDAATERAAIERAATERAATVRERSNDRSTDPRPADGETPVRVSAIADPAGAVFCESVESAHSKHDDSAEVARRLGVMSPPYRIDSQCKYAAVARGDASIYLRLPTRADYEEKIWDHAAGWMVVTEAGGTVTDVTGKPLDFALGRTLRANKGVVATNGRIHAPVIAAVRQVLRA
ncbi:MAG: 3'(2'),5'-bisphosphate nucleotidase [Planctomycetes bacterium]|nr:3'(2'),5'-bisphosphate nucleotidase [Planctomycetota bacterium]